VRKGKYTYDYPRPAVTVDIVVVDRRRRVLLIKRKGEPYAGRWAIPGGFVELDESLEDAAKRELREETGVPAAKLEQLYTFGDPKRDPRGRTISVAYLTRLDSSHVKPKANDDAKDVAWYSIDELPELAFDHHLILRCARERLDEPSRALKTRAIGNKKKR
jgi:8-oxo-dGTP diphosphatase